MKSYDLVVIGTGPAGQKAAIQAAKLGKTVLALEQKDVMGGVCLNTGTIPSKTLREAVLYLTGFQQRGFYGESYALKKDITIQDLMIRCNKVIASELEVIQSQLNRNGVEVLRGRARFASPNRLNVSTSNEEDQIDFAEAVIATGSAPATYGRIPIDGKFVIDSDGIFNLVNIPKSLTVVGAGVIGIEYACMFAALGSKVTLIDQRQNILEFLDGEILQSLLYHMRDEGANIHLGEEVTEISVTGGKVTAKTRSNKVISSDCLLYTVGRQGNTEALNLEMAGLKADERGRLKVNRYFQTEVPNIYAAGDVIGFPSLAATSMEQGRLAARNAFGLLSLPNSELLPYGIYTIPEISMIGKTEEDLTKASERYVIGIARYREIARGQIIGDRTGMLKLLVSATDHKILGVHIIGEGATELIHIGQAYMTLGGKVEQMVDTVFNYPTLAECYKVAALDVANKLR